MPATPAGNLTSLLSALVPGGVGRAGRRTRAAVRSLAARFGVTAVPSAGSRLPPSCHGVVAAVVAPREASLPAASACLVTTRATGDDPGRGHDRLMYATPTKESPCP